MEAPQRAVEASRRRLIPLDVRTFMPRSRLRHWSGRSIRPILLVDFPGGRRSEHRSVIRCTLPAGGGATPAR